MKTSEAWFGLWPQRLALVGLMVVASVASAQNFGTEECHPSDDWIDLAPVWWDVDKPGVGVTLLREGDQLWGYWTYYGHDGQAEWQLIIAQICQDFALGDAYDYFGDPVNITGKGGWNPDSVQQGDSEGVYLQFYHGRLILNLGKPLGFALPSRIHLNLTPFSPF